MYPIFNHSLYVLQYLRVITFIIYICRARATNTQLGQEESSAFTYLEVYGEDGADVPPEIIVAPKDTQIVKGTQVTELQVGLNFIATFLCLLRF